LKRINERTITGIAYDVEKRRYLNDKMMEGAWDIWDALQKRCDNDGVSVFSPFRIPRLTNRKSSEESKLRWWGLLVPAKDRDPSGAQSEFAITPKFVAFMGGHTEIRQALWVVNTHYEVEGQKSTSHEKMLRLDDKSPLVNALSWYEAFDLRNL
jgi:hypothetical protein